MHCALDFIFPGASNTAYVGLYICIMYANEQRPKRSLDINGSNTRGQVMVTNLGGWGVA
jgi:hypothetical protein